MSHPFERRFDCGDEGQSEARPGEIRSARSVRIDCGTRIEFSPTRTPGTPSAALFVRGEGGGTDVVGHGEPRDGGGPREARARGDQGGEQPGQLAAAEEVLPRARALQPPQRLAVPRVRPRDALPHRRRRLVVPAPSRAHPLTSRASRARTAREPGTFFVARLDRQPHPFGRSTDDAPRLPRPPSPTTARSIRPSTTGRRTTRSSSPRPRRRTRTRRRPSFDSRTSGAGSADCSFDCRRCFRTISPWVRLGFPSSRSNELVSAWRRSRLPISSP